MDKLNIPWYLKTFLMVYIVIGCWSIVEVVLWFLEVVGGGANLRKSKDSNRSFILFDNLSAYNRSVLILYRIDQVSCHLR